MPPTKIIDPIETLADDEFDLDLTVIESTTPLITMLCSTDDNCGQTCDNSACATSAAEPF